MSRHEIIRLGSGDRSWTPAQILALVLGVIFIVLGGVALVRAGINESLVEPTTTVAGLSYTPLLGIIEVVFGLLMLTVGAFPRAPEGVVFLGVLALAFGLLLVIEPGAFERSLAAGRAHGWFYVITGGLAAIVGLATPAFLGRSVGVASRERGPAAGRAEPRPMERGRATPTRSRRTTDETRPIGESEDQEAAGPQSR